MRRPSDHSDFEKRGEFADPDVFERELSQNPDATLRRREFLARTAAVAGGAALASTLPAADLVAEAARRTAHRKLPSPQEPADRHLRRADDGEPLVRPLLRLAPRSRREERGPHLPGHRRQPGRHLSPHSGLPGVRAPRSRPWLDRRALAVEQRPERPLRHRQRGGHRQRRVRDRLLPRRGRPVHPRAPPTAYTLYDRWFCSIMASTYPNRHYQWGAQNGGQKSNLFPSEVPGRNRLHLGDDLRPRGGERRHGRLLQLGSPLRGALRRARRSRGLDPIAQFYADAAAGNLPQIVLRRPAVPDGGGGRRPLGRRAPARRHPPRPGVHVRHRARLHRVPALRARGDVHRLRRVGRLLRPRPAAVRP